MKIKQLFKDIAREIKGVIKSAKKQRTMSAKSWMNMS